MDMAMIERWNSVVRAKDTVYHLGDFSFHEASVNETILKALNGKKILIRGNHDKKQTLRLRGWSAVHDYFEMRQGKHFLAMFHYPMASWNRSYHGSVHLHGHTHGNFKPARWGDGSPQKVLDVGVDTHNFTPWSWDEIETYMNSLV